MITLSCGATIRPMNASDVSTVADIHAAGFPTSRSTRLGKPFLNRMYQWYVRYQPGLSLVAILDGEIVGFVTGAIGGGTARRRFRYAFWQIVWGFLTHPQFFLQPAMYEAWHVHVRGLLLQFFRLNAPEEKPIPDNLANTEVKVTLDSITVTSAARGKAVGALLISAFEQAAQDEGATYVALGVKSDNVMARRLYERCGWQLVREDSEHKSVNYVKHFQTR